MLAFFSSFGQTFFISSFDEEFRTAFDLDEQGYGMWYSIATFASGMTILVLGRLIDHLDLRTVCTIVLVGLAAGCLVVGNAVNAVMLAAGFYLLRLNGQGLLSHTAATAMTRYFDRDRGKAMSIATFGHPAGEALLPIGVVLLLGWITWRQSWFALAIVVIVLVLPLTLWLLRGHGDRHAEWVKEIEDEEASVPAEPSASTPTSTSTPAPTRRQWRVRDVIRDPRFYGVLPAVSAPGFLVTGIFFHRTPLLEAKDWSSELFAASFVPFATAQVLTGAVAGILVDRFSGRQMISTMLVPLMIGLLLLSQMDAPVTATLFMAATGMTAGIAGTSVASLWAECYGTKHLGAIRGLVTALMVVGTSAAPVIFGVLLSRGVAYESITLGGAIYTVAAAVVAWAAVRINPSTPARSDGSGA